MIRFEDETGHAVYWYDASEIAKHLSIKHEGKILGRNKFLQVLRFNGYICKDSNQPTSAMISIGVMRWHLAKRRYKQYGMTLFSDKAIPYFENRLKSGTMQIGFQKKKEKEKHAVKLNEVC